MKHFIDLNDLSADEIWHILERARTLKQDYVQGVRSPVLAGRTLGMVFQKPSLRTRVSFDVGMYQLGGYAVYLSPQEIGLGQRESIADVARVLSGYVDAIMARTFAHAHVLELAAHARVPVINGLSDYNHPCQALADLLTIWEQKGQLKDIRLAYVGDGNNVARSLLVAAAKLGMELRLGTPPAYALPAEDLGRVEADARQSGARLHMTHDPQEAVAGADVIYTDVWVSMGQDTERTERLAVFPPYQVNESLLALADSEAVVLHCLPAHRGEEITASVADGAQSLIFAQSENRLHAQKGLLVELLT